MRPRFCKVLVLANMEGEAKMGDNSVANCWNLWGRCPAVRLGFLFSVSIVVLLMTLGWTNPAHARPGDLDGAFGGDGKATAQVGDESYARATALQPDSKIVVAGGAHGNASCDPVCYPDFSLARFNSDGTLDTSFGTGGKVTTSDFMGQVNDVALQPDDGKIIVAGFAPGSGNGFAVARFNPNGTPDASFGTGGRVITSFGADSVDYPAHASSLALQSDGKILAAGTPSGFTGGFALARYNPNGTPDASFDGDGRVTTSVGASTSLASAEGIAVQTDQKIVLAGSTDYYESEIALARYNLNGSPDTSFDGDGKLTTDLTPSSDWAYGVALQGDKIVVAGHNDRDSSDFILARYDLGGVLDQSFGSGGHVTTNFGTTDSRGTDDRANDLAVQSNGKIVVAGDTLKPDTSNRDIAIARYALNGALDTGFGSGGKVVTNMIVDGGGSRSDDHANAVAIQPNGRIVAAGEMFDYDAFRSSIAVVRYQAETPPSPAPAISGFSPTGRTTNRTPTIKAKVTDAVTDLTKEDITLVFNGAEIPRESFNYSGTDVLTYRSPRLPLGTKTVKITATDAANNIGEKQWSFRIVRR